MSIVYTQSHFPPWNSAQTSTNLNAPARFVLYYIFYSFIDHRSMRSIHFQCRVEKQAIDLTSEDVAFESTLSQQVVDGTFESKAPPYNPPVLYVIISMLVGM